MRNFLSMAAVAATTVLLSTPAALAGGDCYGSACYRLVKTPPSFATVSEQVMVRPGHKVARHIPAEFDTVSETVVVRPERTVARHIPAVYGTKAETVMVAPASQRWVVRVDAFGNKVGCWETVPAQYSTVHRQVVIREAQVVHETIPAVTAQRARTVMVRPASVAYDHVPAVYETRHRQVMTHPGSKHWAAPTEFRSPDASRIQLRPGLAPGLFLVGTASPALRQTRPAENAAHPCRWRAPAPPKRAAGPMRGRPDP